MRVCVCVCVCMCVCSCKKVGGGCGHAVGIDIRDSTVSNISMLLVGVAMLSGCGHAGVGCGHAGMCMATLGWVWPCWGGCVGSLRVNWPVTVMYFPSTGIAGEIVTLSTTAISSFLATRFKIHNNIHRKLMLSHFLQ